MFSNTIKIRVNYSHTDKMGYVYYGNYPEFYETGRTELFRSIDLSPAELEKMGIMLPVRKLQAEYISPAYYDELIEVKTCLIDYSPLRINLHTEIFNSSGKLINRGEIQLIFVDIHTGKPKRAYDICKKIKQNIMHYEKK